MPAAAPVASPTPWQLQLFRKSLKKRQKLALLLEMLGPLEDERCLLVTNGDNNGALNHAFRAAGGRWSWAEIEEQNVAALAAFLGEPVAHARPDRLPFADGAFTRVVVIDVHEHLGEVGPLNAEIARVLGHGGFVVVTVPNGDERLPVARLKRWIGMGPGEYGHVVQGYRTAELEEMMLDVDLSPFARGAYARFFTELAELAINFGYVKVLSRRKGTRTYGSIAPSTEAQLRAVGRTYRAYALVYPLVRAFSALDALLPGRGGYAVAVAARKAS